MSADAERGRTTRCSGTGMTKLSLYQNDSLIRHWYDKADMLERKKHRPDYYSILRVSAIATEGEIKAAYRCVDLWWGWGGALFYGGGVE